jgi:hypothetical protein
MNSTATVNHIIETAYMSLAGMMDDSGGILYSSKETLKLGDVYLMGFNPGGSGGLKLRQSIESIRSKSDNSYLDEEWGTNKINWKKGGAPLQRRVQHVLSFLGYETRQVCASNLIFTQSERSNDVSIELANKCWPVHQAIIDLVRPKFIIAIGNGQVSAYRFLHTIIGHNSIENEISANHGSWQIRWFSTEYQGRVVTVLGFPHFSYYNPDKPEILEKLRKEIFEIE